MKVTHHCLSIMERLFSLRQKFDELSSDFFQSQYFYVPPKSKQCTFISRGSGMLQLISVSESFSSPQHFLLFSPPDITLDRNTRISRLSSTRFLFLVLFSSGVTFPLMLDLAILHHTGCFFHWQNPEFAKCWPVRNRFQNRSESQTGTPHDRKTF